MKNGQNNKVDDLNNLLISQLFTTLSESDGFHIFPLLVVEPAAEAYPTTLVTEDESIC